MVDQESEDRLDQLMMEDGLSDAHIEALALSTVEKEKEDESEIEKKRSSYTTQEPEADVKSEGGVGGVITPAECQELLFQCQETLSQVCNIIHSRCTKILNIRAKVSPTHPM